MNGVGVSPQASLRSRPATAPPRNRPHLAARSRNAVGLPTAQLLACAAQPAGPAVCNCEKRQLQVANERGANTRSVPHVTGVYVHRFETADGSTDWTCREGVVSTGNFSWYIDGLSGLLCPAFACTAPHPAAEASRRTRPLTLCVHGAQSYGGTARLATFSDRLGAAVATLIIADDQDGNWQCGKHYFFCIKTQAIHRCTPWVARLSPNPVGVRTAGFRRKPAAGERNHLRLQLALNTSKELFT